MLNNYQTKKLKNRIISIDFLKVISIYGVVFIHSSIKENYISQYTEAIFRFSVPIFIIYFSYFLNKKLKNQNKKYPILLYRFKKLFYAYLFFTILDLFLFYNNVFDISIKKLITSYLTGYGWSGQYFFIILFQIIIFFPFIKKISEYNFYYILIINLFLYLIFSYFLWKYNLISLISDRLFIYWVFYVILGIKLSESKNKLYFLNKYYPYFIILSIIYTLYEYKFFIHNSMPHSPYVLSSVLILSIIIALYPFIYKIKSYGKIDQYIVSISKRTMGIFLLNPILIHFIKPIFMKSIININSDFLVFILVVLFSILIFILCIILIYILQKTFLRKVILN